MAARHDARQADQRDGQCLAVSRRLQRLDHADQGSHRHAGDRHPHAGRSQGDRQGPQCHEKVSRDIEAAIKTAPGTASAFAERIIGGYYLEIVPDRTQLARYGLMVGDVQQVIASAIGPETITTTVEGREPYNVSLRYPRDVRSTRRRSGARFWCRSPTVRSLGRRVPIHPFSGSAGASWPEAANP